MMFGRFFVFVFVGFACGTDPIPSNVQLIVTVADESDEPVAGAEVTVDGLHTGSTSGDGKFEKRISGPEGRNIRIEIECPDGWLSRGGKARELPVRFLRPIGNSVSGPVPMEADFECVGRHRQIVLLVRTDGGQGLPVRALGREIAVVNSEGVAQTVFNGAPGEEFEVFIDTTGNPSLRPSMPTRRLVIPKDSQIIVFNQKFEIKKKGRRAQKNKHRRAHRPRRI